MVTKTKRIFRKLTPKLKYYNGTKHQINFYKRGQTLRHGTTFSPYEDEKPILSLPVQRCLSVHFEQEEYFDESGILIKKKVPVKIDPLPEGYDIYIVSSSYSMHCFAPRIRVIDSPLINPQGLLVGCLGLKQELKGATEDNWGRY